ncbi:MAG: tetratricopeptide repeat protein [Chlamydiia bacterium]|nr:tetratricopeptide repeat protein [Chlamydiia bacterium]
MFKSNLRNGFIFAATLLLTVGATAKESMKSTQVQSDEEAFLIRRIAEFWKDGDFAIVKTQIIDFLDRYPESDLSDYFLGILGDIYLQDNAYEEALSTYQLIKDYGVSEKTLINKLQCYYELDQYEELAADGRPYLSSKTPEIVDRKGELYFLMGEALFRQALKEENLSKKQILATDAQKYYECLPAGQYEEIAGFALAEIAAILGNHEKGANAYRALAEKHPTMAEDLLFQVASLESHYNKLGAAETFRKVKEMGGKRAHEATFNLLVLLFQNEEYEEILSTYKNIAANVPDAFQPTFNFIVGKSFFSSGDYQNAVEPLQSYIDSTFIPSDQLKNALLIQMTCAHQTSNESLFSTSFEKLYTLFPSDTEIPKALFMHAMILKEQGAISQADEKLKMIKDNYPSFEDEESFVFEYGLLAHQNERWQESYEAFKGYVTQYDESARVDAAWKLFLSSAINLYKHAEEGNSYTKAQFFTDLQGVLDHSNYLSQQEMRDYALLYAKTAYELDHYSDALRCLQDHIFTHLTEEEDCAALAEAHFIAGLCHAEVQADHSAFCMHLEQAMTLNPDLYDSGPTHLQLYNAYISLAGYGDAGNIPADAKQQKEFIDHAAEHLQEAVSKGEVNIKDENRLWLANHYFQKVKQGAESELMGHPELSNAIDRASSHYQTLLMKDGRLIDMDTNTLYLENEVIKLAKLFEYQNDHKQKLFLVKSLLQQQSEKPELNWSSQKDALYELATVYDALGEKEKAFETYTFIHSQANHFPSALASNAALEAARLHFDLLEEGMRSEKNEEVLAILNDLKELQIRKNAQSEPTHLEAALEYAKIRSMISSPEEQDSRYLFFLKRIQDDFNSQEDLVTQDYLVTLNRDTEKKQIFDAYMKFIEAEKFRLEAKNLYQQERLGEMEELHENALTLYSELKNDPNTPKELLERAVSSIDKINALVAY